VKEYFPPVILETKGHTILLQIVLKSHNCPMTFVPSFLKTNQFTFLGEKQREREGMMSK
jgi:hypothetical protein